MIRKLLLVGFGSIAATGIFYAGFIALLASPFLQRHALYCHKLYSVFWQDVTDPESFGFAKNQVTPLNISTPDGETLYAWHVLPLGLYVQHEETLSQQPMDGIKTPIEERGALKLLQQPDTRLVINFHGNAGHVAQGWRTDAYKSMGSFGAHILTFDYRGFGKSSGAPTEEGLIIDGISVVEWALHVARILPENIVLVGHSLGTAVATAVVEHYAQNRPDVDFAALILMSGFSDIPNLMKTYMIGGVIPVLSPLKPYPVLQDFIASKIQDTWDTATRITRLVETKRSVKVHMLHAKNDMDINWRHSDLLFDSACRGLPGVHVKETEQVEWVEGNLCRSEAAGNNGVEKDGDGDGAAARKRRSVKLSRLRHGGHNRVIAYAPLALAVREAFETVNYC